MSHTPTHTHCKNAVSRGGADDALTLCMDMCVLLTIREHIVSVIHLGELVGGRSVAGLCTSTHTHTQEATC